MSVTLLASRHPFCHSIPTPKAGIHKVNRMDIDLPVQTFIKKKLYKFEIKPYISEKPVPTVKPGMGGFTTYR